MHQAIQLSVSSQVTITMIPKIFGIFKREKHPRHLSHKQSFVMYHWLKSLEANCLTILQKYT